jgi:hypothetical protein
VSTDPASTTLTPPPSSNGAAPSPAPPAGADAASNLTPTPASRPDYVPEPFWDAATNSVKPEFAAHYTELTTAKAALDARVAARPEKPEGYELKFPEGFTPELPIKFDETDPRLAPLRTMAHQLNLSQAEFGELLKIEATRTIAETKAYNEAVAAETKKLGANATQRVTAVKTWLTGVLGPEAANDLLGTDNTGGLVVFSEAAVKHLEKLQLAMSNGGAAPYSNGHRTPPAPPPKRREEILYPNLASTKG